MALVALGAAACGSSGGQAVGASSSPGAAAPATSAAAPASAAVTTKFVTMASSRSFAATVSALKHSVASNGMMILGSLDQAKALSMTGLHLPGAQSFFVGNPTTGKMFFQADPAIGTVIPPRMYVWQGTAGKAEVGYFDPAPLFAGISPKLAAGARSSP